MQVCYVDTPVARIGREIRRICEERNLTYKQVAQLCNESLKLLYPQQPFDPIVEARITRIVEAHQNPLARGVARHVHDYELVAIPHALKFSLDDVMGTAFKRCALIWDPFADPEYSAKVLRLLQEHGKNAKELIGWAEFLPCSMETPEFMRAHHTQLFRSQPAVSPREWRHLMDQYNDIGDRRRMHVLSVGRTWYMRQLMRVSDLERIVNGTDEFDFDKQIRKEGLAYLARLIVDPSSRMQFILAEDEDVRPIERSFREFDSQFMIDERVTVWRSHGGRISWSEDPVYIAHHRAVLERFVSLATYKAPDVVYDQLMYYVERVR
jgi:hypothetical protein